MPRGKQGDQIVVRVTEAESPDPAPNANQAIDATRFYRCLLIVGDSLAQPVLLAVAGIFLPMNTDIPWDVDRD
jgi:hypothetical protein